MTLLSASAVMLGQGSNSVTVVAGTTFSLTVGINAVVASVNTFNFSPSPSFQFGTASSITGTVTFADPSGAAITGSGNVPNYLQPITITSNDPHVTITPSSVTTPGQSFTAHYDGSALVASQVMITATSGSTVVASGPVILPGLIVTRYNLGALGSGFTAGPEQIVVGPDGNIWWTERITNMIGRINPSIGASSIVHFPSGFASGFAAGITVGPDGNMWYSNDGRLIARMTTSGTVPGTGPAQITVGAPGSAVGRLNTDSQGNVWYLNGGAGFSQVAYVDASFTVHTFGAKPSGVNSIRPFGGLSLGADNAMWFTEENAYPNYPTNRAHYHACKRLQRVRDSEYTDPNSGPLIYPTDITKGPDGKIWYSEFDGNSNAPNQFYANFVPGVTINITEFPNVINPAAFANLVTIFTGADGNIWLAEGGGAVRVIPSNPTMPNTEFFTDNGQTSMIDCLRGTTPDNHLWCTAIGSAGGNGFIPTADSIITWAPR